MLTISVEGKPVNVRLATSYPALPEVNSLGFHFQARSAISHWRFTRPHTQTGQFVSVPQAFYDVVFRSLFVNNYSSPYLMSLPETLHWLCSDEMLPILPIKMIGATMTAAPAPTSGAWGLADDSSRAARFSLTLDKRLTRATEAITKSSVEVQYCVDPKGRLANVIFIGADDAAHRTALSILNALHFSVRRKFGSPAWTCGLSTHIRFYGRAVDGALGIIERSSFNKLSPHSDSPKLLSATAPKLHVKIPTGIQLPQEATIAIRFCISADGKPYDLHIIQAKPPKIFNQAALETVAGWHFASSQHAMCDVYQKVGFKIPHTK